MGNGLSQSHPVIYGRAGVWTQHFLNLFYFIYFIFGCVGSSLLCAGFSLVSGFSVSGGYSLLQCTGFSLRWLLVAEHGALGVRASVVVACGL